MRLNTVRKKQWLAFKFKIKNAPIVLLDPRRKDFENVLKGLATGYAEIKISQDWLESNPTPFRPEELNILALDQAIRFTRRVTTFRTHMNNTIEYEVLESAIVDKRAVHPE